MPSNKKSSVEKTIKTLKLVSFAALLIGIAAIVVGIYAYLGAQNAISIASTAAKSTNTTVKLIALNVTSSLITPNDTYPGYPVITQNQSFGSRLTNINAPLNSSELSIINNAPDSYFTHAGELLLSGSFQGVGLNRPDNSSTLMVNGKPTVIYLGAISCVYCAENRWAMALALSRFGNFSALYKGYSALKDADLPTLFWRPVAYNATAEMNLGSFYSSKYLNFLPLEFASNIYSGFNFAPLSQVQSMVASNNNAAYDAAVNVIVANNNFAGTPYTIWGRYSVGGADASIFSNGTTTIMNMTHEQILHQIAYPTNTFGYAEYGAADIYIALLCKSINNTAPACGMNTITAIASRLT